MSHWDHTKTKQIFFEVDDVGARTEGEDTVVENDQVMFYARGQAVELSDLTISKIVLKQSGGEY